MSRDSENIGFSPGDARTSSQWKESLMAGFKSYSFKGNLDTGATLMEAFTEGVTYIEETYRAHGSTLARPEIVIVTKEDFISSDFAAHTNLNLVYVDAATLEQRSQYDPQKIINVESNTLPPTITAFTGTLPDLHRLAGNEEAHHRVVSQVRPEMGKGNMSPNKVTVYEYKAQDIEWHALRWQVRYAREMQMPQRTQDVLRNQLEESKKIRRMRKIGKK